MQKQDFGPKIVGPRCPDTSDPRKYEKRRTKLLLYLFYTTINIGE